ERWRNRHERNGQNEKKRKANQAGTSKHDSPPGHELPSVYSVPSHPATDKPHVKIARISHTLPPAQPCTYGPVLPAPPKVSLQVLAFARRSHAPLSRVRFRLLACHKCSEYSCASAAFRPASPCGLARRHPGARFRLRSV